MEGELSNLGVQNSFIVPLGAVKHQSQKRGDQRYQRKTLSWSPYKETAPEFYLSSPTGETNKGWEAENTLGLLLYIIGGYNPTLPFTVRLLVKPLENPAYSCRTQSGSG